MSQSLARSTRRIALPALITVVSLANAKHALAQAEPPPPASSTPALAPEEPTPPTPATPGPSVTPPPPQQELVATSPPPAAAPKEEKPSLKVTPTGYIEAYYAYNLNRPSNGITNFRGFDNRHNSLTLQNVALGATWESGAVSGKIMLQVGAVPTTYYAGEPSLPGAGGANGSDGALWKYLQEAYLTYKAPVGRGLSLQAGLFASPVGYEVFAVKDNWNWSRSNLFFGFPFYHAGARATYEWSDHLSSTFSVFNGWNNVVDNNEEKSVEAHLSYTFDKLTGQVLYFGGIERSTGSAEGPYWRHHFDATAQYDATDFLSFAAQADYGWEPNRIGTARWYAGALYARVKPIDRVYVALRGDRFYEQLATDSGGRASAPIFYGGSEWVSSATATLEVRPVDPISLRLEYRHDVSEAPLFFGRNVQGDGTSQAPYVANARTQDTVLLGGTAWF